MRSGSGCRARVSAARVEWAVVFQHLAFPVDVLWRYQRLYKAMRMTSSGATGVVRTCVPGRRGIELRPGHVEGGELAPGDGNDFDRNRNQALAPSQKAAVRHDELQFAGLRSHHVSDVADRAIVVIEHRQADEIAGPLRLRKPPLHLFFRRKLARLARRALSGRLWAAGRNDNRRRVRVLLSQNRPGGHTEQNGQCSRPCAPRHAWLLIFPVVVGDRAG